MQSIVLVTIQPTMQAIAVRYGFFEPYTQHQKGILSMYFSEALTRIYGLIVCPDGKEMSGRPFSVDELKLISDTTMDPIITTTMGFDLMRRVNYDQYYSCRVSSSVALILAGV